MVSHQKLKGKEEAEVTSPSWVLKQMKWWAFLTWVKVKEESKKEKERERS